MHTFPDLPYAYNALEPYIDSMTMEIHYSRHHKTYFDKFMDAVKGTANENKSLSEIFADIKNCSAAIRNNGGGLYNHTFFWNCMGPDGQREPQGKLADAIKSRFGSYEELKTQMNQAGVGRFGSGFVWLVVNSSGNLEIGSTPNQDNPLMADAPIQGEPILAIDVWEHAYYLKYQNKRPDYLNAFWNVVDWTAPSKKFEGL